MSPIRPLFCALALGLALGACATPPDEAAAPPPADADAGTPVFAETPPPPAMDEPASEEPAMTCDSSKAQWALGKLADEALVAKAKADSGSERLRVIRPGMAVTMDHREDRLNLEVDAENRVTSVRCG